MKRRRHTPEQVIRMLREAERLLGEGKTIPEAAKELAIARMRGPSGGRGVSELRGCLRPNRLAAYCGGEASARDAAATNPLAISSGIPAVGTSAGTRSFASS